MFHLILYIIIKFNNLIKIIYNDFIDLLELINLYKKNDACETRTHAGNPNGLAGRRLNHSAKASNLTMNI